MHEVKGSISLDLSEASTVCVRPCWAVKKSQEDLGADSRNAQAGVSLKDWM